MKHLRRMAQTKEKAMFRWNDIKDETAEFMFNFYDGGFGAGVLVFCIFIGLIVAILMRGL